VWIEIFETHLTRLNLYNSMQVSRVLDINNIFFFSFHFFFIVFTLRFGSVFPGLARFWPGFFGLARFFSGFFSVRFGSVFPVPGLKNRNRTEPVGFFKILIGLIGFFYGSVFSVFFF